MNDARPAIPRPLQRQVHFEAGDRCAIPTCHATSGLQIHHIDPWSRVQKHEFHNLILLCANCHSRVTSGEIDRMRVQMYKDNLVLLSNRYTEVERRILRTLGSMPDPAFIALEAGISVLYQALVEDGLIISASEPSAHVRWSDHDLGPGVLPPAPVGPVLYCLTNEGVEFTRRWFEAEELD